MNTNKLLGILALSVAVVFSTSAANAAESKMMKAAPSAEACTSAANVTAKHELGCKLTKAEKKEYRATKKATKTSKKTETKTETSTETK